MKAARSQMDPGSAAHYAESHSASKTRANALMALHSIRGTADGFRSATKKALDPSAFFFC
jgi:hypothetical protein